MVLLVKKANRLLRNVVVAVCSLFVFSGAIMAQEIRVTGKVIDQNGEALVGVYVILEGTRVASSTEIDGTYSINVPRDAKLTFSLMGYKDLTVDINGRAVINVTLEDDATMLEDVVVTALGIKKERKALGYSVQEMKSDELLRNKNTNVINSLAGKMAGVNVVQSSGAAGAGASITIRGGNSTSEGRTNQPLFVVDGIIYDNSTSVVGNSATDGMTRSNTTYSNRVMDINPEDIETMSVLKGAAASALYGSRAADGVIVITTKKGSEGELKVDFSSRFSTSWANKLPVAQTEFGRGSYSTNGALLTDGIYSSWGERLGSNATIYDNIGEFFQNGTVLDNNVSVSSGGKNSSFYLSASNNNETGLVPNTGYNKTTIRFNGEQRYGRLTLGANVAYSIANTDKTLTSGGLYNGGGNGTMSAVYGWPQTENMKKYLNDDGTKYRLFEGILDLAADTENPYWIINKNKMTDKTKRFTGSLSASFRLTDWWDISARAGYDQYITYAYSYVEPGSSVSAIYQGGQLSKSDRHYTYLSTNVMSNMHKTFGDFDLSLLLGTTAEDTEILSQTHWGYNFVTAGTVSFSNISTDNKFFTDGTTQKRLVGAYGELRASYKNIFYLTVTGRNDWSSTLPINSRSYFYPSVSGSFVFTELIPENNVLTFGKIRGSWAEVGKDANAYATMTYLVSPIVYGSFTGVGNQYTRGNPYLVPEIQRSWEVGAELRFFDGLFGLDYTYYHSETRNQIASPRLSNAGGYIMTSINSGSVINKGMEISLTATPISNRNFEWDIMLNLSYNRGRLGQFLDGVGVFYPTDAQFGTVRAASIPNGGYFSGLTGYRNLYETKEVTTIVDGKEVKEKVEIEGGRYQVDPNTGLYKISSTQNEIIGDREPTMIGGLNNTFRFKDLTFSFLLDLRLGGVVYNGTDYYMNSMGLSPKTTENGRESVTVSGVSSVDGSEFNQTYYADQSYVIAGVTYSGKSMIQQYWSNYRQNSYNFITDVNWLKLRSISLSYDFTRLIKRQNVIKRLSATATGTNLLTWTNYKGMDPEVSTAGGTGGSGATGIDYLSVPARSSFTFGINITF